MNAITKPFGTLTDYATGTPIRPATAQDWLATALAVAEGRPQGTWTDPDDETRTVFVEGGPDVEVTDTEIEALEAEAIAAGETARASLCFGALHRDEISRSDCARVILERRLNVAGE